MDVLVVSTNRNSQPVSVMPVGACIVAEAAEQAGYRVRVLDLMYKRDPLRALESEIDKSSPDVVGLSVRNIDDNNMQHPVTFFEDLAPLAYTIRERTKATIILGGSAVAVMPEALLRHSGASWAVLGNGEVAFPELLAALSRSNDPMRIPGVAWFENNVFMKNPVSLSPFSSGCLSPDFHRWVDVNAYLSRLSTVPIQSKRGCPFKCVYCTYAAGEGHTYRLYSPESIVDAITALDRKGLRDIEFVDSIFNSPYAHAMAICEGLARIRLDVRLQSLELNPMFIDDALLTTMEKAGFAGIGITAESASDVVLEGLRKGFTSEHVYRAANYVRRHELPCFWIFMLGGPGETSETVLETLGFAERYIRPEDVAFFNIGIRIYPGTELENLARKEGTLTVPPDEMLSPVFYFSPSLSLSWLTEKLRNTMSRHLNFINTDSLGLSILPTIQRLGYRFGVKQPLWRHTRYIRRGLRFLGSDV